MIDFSGLIGLVIKGQAYSGGNGEVQGKVVGVSFRGEKYDQPIAWIINGDGITGDNKLVGVLVPGAEVTSPIVPWLV